MTVAIITGSAGLVGSEAAYYFACQGMEIVGIDNDLRAYFFGAEASTSWNRARLEAEIRNYTHYEIDVRDDVAVDKIFRRYRTSIGLVIHAASQPSHDWSVREPLVDFDINARATLVLLEAARSYCSEAPFIYVSTNKVYGDRPNALPLQELETRWEIARAHEYEDGISEAMPVDTTLHSLFGVSKLAGDLAVQEYGRYFGMPTVCFRAGCLTGARHSGAPLHGFLAYLMHCAVTGKAYTVLGYKGKQVRDNVDSGDLVRAFDEFRKNPRSGEVYNMGGSRFSNCSMLEAIRLSEEISGNEMKISYHDKARVGDHMWWVSDIAKFQRHYPTWRLTRGIREILTSICEAQRERSGLHPRE